MSPLESRDLYFIVNNEVQRRAFHLYLENEMIAYENMFILSYLF